MRRSIRSTELALTDASKPSRFKHRLDHPHLSPGITSIKTAGLSSADQVNPDNVSSTQAVWLAVYLPDVCLAVCDWDDIGLNLGSDSGKPRLVIEQKRGQSIVYAACEFAFEAGITAGMKLLSAQALCSELQVRERQPDKERQHLISLAENLQVFTPMVHVELPDAILLEVRDSINLFGGLAALYDSLQHSLHSFLTSNAKGQKEASESPCFILAGTPTPEASLILARAGQPALITEIAAIKTALSSLPVSYLPLAGVVKNAKRSFRQLHDMGVDNLQDLWRLPLSGLKERFSDNFITLLERIQGKAIDVRPAHESKPCFSQSLDLETETDSRQWLSYGCEHLLEQLCDWLGTINAVTSQMEFVFLHNNRVIERMNIGNRQGNAHKSQWLPLLNLYLERQVLVEPVNRLQLHSQHVYPAHLQNLDLFRQSSLAGCDDWSTTLAELSIRLGESHLFFLNTQADHRPEKQLTLFSSEDALSHRPECPKAVSDKSQLASNNLIGSRPCWLLNKAQRLDKLLSGWPASYQRISGPERIESGWWDGVDMRRDYYVMQDTQSRHVWVYRDLENQHWFLHGLFA
ncbi:MAG: DNA polymerase Y family protein [Arenicellaceae bacterium]|nr:DNA polymerase Y family protein [Arenicellaceae bacterium]